MCHDFKDGFFIIIDLGISKPGIPQADESIIWAAGKDARVELMPSHILNGRIMMQNLKDRQNPPIFLFVLLNIPNANPLIRKSWQQKILVNRIPAQPITFSSMANQFTNRFIHRGQIDVAFARCYCDYAWISWAVTSSVDFAWMLNLLNYWDFVSFFLEIGLSFGFVGVVNSDLEKLALLRIGVAGCDDSVVGGVILMWLRLR